MSSAYQILRVLPTATPAQIKAAYQTLTLQYQGEQGQTPTESTADALQQVSLAWEILRDADQRRAYDQGMIPLRPVEGKKGERKEGKAAEGKDKEERSVLGCEELKAGDIGQLNRRFELLCKDPKWAGYDYKNVFVASKDGD